MTNEKIPTPVEVNDDPQTKLLMVLAQPEYGDHRSVVQAYNKLTKDQKDNLKLDADSAKLFDLPKLQSKIKDGSFNNEALYKKVDEYVNPYMKYANDRNIYVLGLNSPYYSKNMKQSPTKDAPLIVHAKGNILLLNRKGLLAMPGSRNPTDNGKKMTKNLAGYYSNNHYTIVDGLANGVDTIAHKTALSTGGNTIAWLSTGLDKPIYPKEHRSRKQGGDGLADDMVNSGHGLLLSTTPLNEDYETASKKFVYRLVKRDGYQAGCADGVAGIETSIKGGTMHALQSGFVQNRPVAVMDWRTYNKNHPETLEQQYNKFQNEPKVMREEENLYKYNKGFHLDSHEDFVKHFSGTDNLIQDGIAHPLNSNDSLKFFNDKMRDANIARNDENRSELSMYQVSNLKNRKERPNIQYDSMQTNLVNLNDFSLPEKSAKHAKKLNVKKAKDQQTSGPSDDDDFVL